MPGPRLCVGMSSTHSRRRQSRRPPSPNHGSIARQTRLLCREAASLGSPLLLEQWTSGLLGQVWQRRGLVPEDRGLDPMFFLARPILDSFAEVGGDGAKAALAAVAQIDGGRLGSLARELADSLDDATTPDWIAQVGTATIVRAFSDRARGDGEALLLEADGVGESAHMVAVFIDAKLGGMAKHLSLTRPLDPLNLAGESIDDGSLMFKKVDPVLACRRVRAAIKRTDDGLGMLADDGFAYYRALAIARTTHHVARLPLTPRRPTRTTS